MNSTAIKAFLKAWALPIGAALVIAIALGLYLQGRRDGKAGEVIGQQERTIEVQQQVGNSNGIAAEERVSNAVTLEQQRKELADATRAAESPDDRRRLRGCVILRQQGRDTSRIPGCGGPAGGPGTAVP